MVVGCQVRAAAFDETLGVSRIALARCIGCGNCVVACPSGAISLLKKEKEVIPPETHEQLYDVIMARKKGVFGKIKLATRLMLRK